MSSSAVQCAWIALKEHAGELQNLHTRDLFALEPDRFEKFSVGLDNFLFDFSKHKILRKTLDLLMELGRARDLEARRDALFAGERVNNTEHRAAMHMALRDLSRRPLPVDGADVRGQIESERDKVYSFAEAVR